MAIGGVQNGIIESLSVADRERFDFAVLCYKKAGNWARRVRELGIPVHAQKTLPPWDPYQIWRLSREIRRIAPDLVYIYQAQSVLAGATAARLAGVRRIVIHYTSDSTDHWKNQNVFLNAWERRLTRGASAVVAVSNTVAQVNARHMRLDPARILVVPNGVNRERWMSPPPHDLRAELGIPPETPLVGYVTRYHEVKRIEDFFEAARIITHDRKFAGVPAPVFLLIGSGPEPFIRRYRELAENLAGDADIRLLGERHDAPSLLPNLDVGVLASESEGCPNVILEYMCARVPIAASDIPAVREIVAHDREALLSPPREPRALAQSIERLLNEPDLRARLVDAGFEKSKAYAWEKTERKYEEIYARVLAGEKLY